MTDWSETAIVLDCDGTPMVAVVHEPAAAPQRLAVLIVVGGPQYRVGSHRQFTLMARTLAGFGHPVMRFDYRGMGDSGGQPRDFASAGDDIRAAIDGFWQRLGAGAADGMVLFGLCDAASAILMHAAGDPRVRALVLANPWVRSASGEARSYIQHYYLRRLLQASFWRKLFSGQARIGESLTDFANKLATSRRSATGVSDFVTRMRDGLARFDGPVMILLSGRDLTAREFDELCSNDSLWKAMLAARRVHVHRLPEADHTFSRRRDLDAAVAAVSAWFSAAAAGMGGGPCR
jgi:exosortase A-associated hydrolase 1